MDGRTNKEVRWEIGNAGVSFWQSGGQCLRRLACHHAALHTPTTIADLLRWDLYPDSPFQPRVTVTFGRGGNKRTVVNKRRATGVRLIEVAFCGLPVAFRTRICISV
ncbi:hypothetical protein R1flu_002207 [Riccia fluitans]|uniref:Uncharacterized protein n=1 Tax=Riccia fluitans TaxID=41844 RepID=A0ABD1Y5G1_9MARC